MNFYNTRIVEHHDEIMNLNASWADHLNFLLSIHVLIPHWELELIEDELHETLCYDV